MKKDFELQRQQLISTPQSISILEKEYFDVILKGLIENYIDIEKDFNETSSIRLFWEKYAPRQRGRKPRCDAYPWGEVGEKVLDAYIYKIICSAFPDARFVGLPYGHDIRFVTKDAFIHIDIKSTGPTDNTDEVVASPNQVSGDGYFVDEEGVHNNLIEILGPSKTSEFRPELPPFYIINGTSKITLTYYLKCVYDVVKIGHQPLNYIELISVPNGILMFDTLMLYKTKGLLTPGKDILKSSHKRTRIKLNPLSRLNKWRCVKVKNQGEKIETLNR